MQLLQAISKRAMSDRGFSDSRLALTGTKLLRDASDYDENGEVKRRVYGGVYKSNVIKLQKTIFEIIDNVARRICAGLYYYAANGKILMGDTVDNLNVDWVNFSRIDDNGDWIDINVSENIVLNRVFGNYRPPKWVDVVSGSPEVFMSKIIIDKTSKKRLLAKLIFYENITCFCYP